MRKLIVADRVTTLGERVGLRVAALVVAVIGGIFWFASSQEQDRPGDYHNTVTVISGPSAGTSYSYDDAETRRFVKYVLGLITLFGSCALLGLSYRGLPTKVIQRKVETDPKKIALRIVLVFGCFFGLIFLVVMALKYFG